MRTKDNELVNRIKLYIEEQIDRRGRMPTIRDIAEALDVGKSSVQRYLEYMVEQGILARGEYGYESIEQSRTERTVSVAKLGYVPCGPLSEEYECIDGYSAALTWGETVFNPLHVAYGIAFLKSIIITFIIETFLFLLS